MGKNNTGTLALYAKIYLSTVVVWSVLVASFFSVVASQGLSVSGSGLLTATTGGIVGWIVGFVIALFEGACFLAVYGAFAALFVAIVLDVCGRDAAQRRFLRRYTLGCAALDVLWAATVATFFSSLLSHIGIQIAAADTATTLGAVLLWLIGFVVAFIAGTVFLALGSAVCFLVLAFSSK